jgi:hypothetical protein
LRRICSLVLFGVFLIATINIKAQPNKIYLVSKQDNHTTYKLTGYSFWSQMYWYKVNTGDKIYRGLVRFGDSTLTIKQNVISYDSIYSIEYSRFNKVANGITYGTRILFVGVGAYLVSASGPNSPGRIIGLIIGIPSAIGVGLSIKEILKPKEYILDDYYISTKKGPR